MSHIHTTEKSPGATNSEGRHTNTTGATFCTGGAIQQASDGKVTATVIAQLTLAGHAVHRLESGYLVSLWGMSKFCPDFASLVEFARQIGACHD